MKTNEIENIDIKVYNNFYDKVGKLYKLKDFLTTVSYRNATKLNILRQIADKDKQKEYKQNYIECATLSCICNDNGKGADNIIKKNNLIVLDIDKDDNEILHLEKHENLEFVKNWIFKLDYVYAVSKSCRGNGIYAIVMIKDGEDIYKHFLSLERFFKQHNINIDLACKNINRLRFASYDENILIKNGEVSIYEDKIDLESEKKLDEFFNFTVKKKIDKIRDNETLLIKIYKGLLMNGYELEDSYNYWIHESMNLHCLGEQGLEFFKEISRRSAGYKNDTDVENKWNATKKTVMVDDIIGEYINKAKRYIGENWWNEVKNL